MSNWISNNKSIVITLIVAVAASIIVALFVGADLSWLPPLLKGIVGQ